MPLLSYRLKDVSFSFTWKMCTCKNIICLKSVRSYVKYIFVDFDECSMTNPCLHGGTCTNTIGGYRCFCPPEWTGEICETGEPLI